MGWNDLGGLVWLLAIGALFYLMMRKGGCGMGASHSHGGDPRREVGAPSGIAGHAGHGAREQEPVDPVCGMHVDPERAAGTRSTSDRTFYLCSTACLEKFDRDPAAYANRALGSEVGGRAHRHGGC